MVSFQRQKWQVDCFFAPLNLRIFPYSFGLIYPQYEMLKSTVVDFLYGSYGPNRITHPKDMKHVVISVSVVVYYSPYVKCLQIFGIFPNSTTVLPGAYSICILQAFSFPFQSHILSQWFSKLILQKVFSLRGKKKM